MTCLFSSLDAPPAATPARVHAALPPVDSLRSKVAAMLWTYPTGMSVATLAGKLDTPAHLIESRLLDLRRDGFAVCDGQTWRHTGGAK